MMISPSGSGIFLRKLHLEAVEASEVVEAAEAIEVNQAEEVSKTTLPSCAIIGLNK